MDRREIVIATILAMLACGGSKKPPTESRAPVVATIQALDGGTIALRSYRGRIIVLHFFATWSVAAQVDIDQMKEAHRTKGDHAVVIGIALDKDGYKLVSPWRSAMKVQYLVGLADDALRSGRSGLGQVMHVPSTLVIGANGVIKVRVERQLRAGELRRLLAPLLPKR